VVFATGALERLIAFPGNDRPGVMLAGAAHQYLRRYGVAVGRRPVFLLNSDEAYEAVLALSGAGLECAVIDVRESSLAAERVRALGAEVQLARWSWGLRARGGSHRQGRGCEWRARRDLEADCLLISGGYSPLTTLASQLGARLTWQEAIAAFTPDLAPAIGRVAGAAARRRRTRGRRA